MADMKPALVERNSELDERLEAAQSSWIRRNVAQLDANLLGLVARRRTCLRSRWRLAMDGKRRRRRRLVALGRRRIPSRSNLYRLDD